MLGGTEWRLGGVRVNLAFALRAGILKASGSADPMWFLQSAEAEPPRSAVIVSMSPPGYPSAMVCIPAEPASVSPGKVIVSPASEPRTLLPPLAEREGTRETSPAGV